MLQLSRFPWGEDPAAWLRSMALAADEAGFAGLARDGPPDPDPAGRPSLGADPRAVGDPRAGGRARHAAEARHAGLAGDLPARGHHGQGRGDARRAVGRPGVRRRRRRVVGPRARGVRPAVPTGTRAPRRAGGGDRDDAGAVGGGHQGVRRRAGQPARDHVVPPARRADPGDRRRARRAPHPGDRGAARRRLQPAVRRRACSTTSSRCCAVTSTRSDGRTTTSRSPCSTCPSSAGTATTSGPGSSGCAGARPRRRTPRRSTRARSPSSATAGPGWPSAASAPCSCRTPDLDGPDDVLALAGLTAGSRPHRVDARTASSSRATSARRWSGRGPGGRRSAAGSAGCPRRCRGSWSRGPTSPAARPRRTRHCRTARRTTA